MTTIRALRDKSIILEGLTEPGNVQKFLELNGKVEGSGIVFSRKRLTDVLQLAGSLGLHPTVDTSILPSSTPETSEAQTGSPRRNTIVTEFSRLSKEEMLETLKVLTSLAENG